jgi:hypothetical protein
MKSAWKLEIVMVNGENILVTGSVGRKVHFLCAMNTRPKVLDSSDKKVTY